jgi:hypothetical protein
LLAGHYETFVLLRQNLVGGNGCVNHVDEVGLVSLAVVNLLYHEVFVVQQVGKAVEDVYHGRFDFFGIQFTQFVSGFSFIVTISLSQNHFNKDPGH